MSKSVVHFPLVKGCIQAIGQSHCKVMSIKHLRDTYHMLRHALDLQKCCGIMFVSQFTQLLLPKTGYGSQHVTGNMATIHGQGVKNILNKDTRSLWNNAMAFLRNHQCFKDLANLFKAFIKLGLKISPNKCQFVETS